MRQLADGFRLVSRNQLSSVPESRENIVACQVIFIHHLLDGHPATKLTQHQLNWYPPALNNRPATLDSRIGCDAGSYFFRHETPLTNSLYE